MKERFDPALEVAISVCVERPPLNASTNRAGRMDRTRNSTFNWQSFAWLGGGLLGPLSLPR